jgi:putative transposase
MARTKTNKRAKNKKPSGDPLIRTDVWDLRANREQKVMMRLTILEYRRYLMPLVLIINSQWVRLAKLSEKERINWVEKAIHQTAKNPSPRYSYYQKVIQ